MLKKIKQITGIFLVILLFTLVFIAILSIWSFISNEVAKEALIKISYTFGVIYIISLLIMLLINKTNDEK